MDEDRLKQAFARIKSDMDIIKSELNMLKKAHSLNADVKSGLNQLKGYNIEKFTANLEKEFVTLNAQIKEFNTKQKRNNEELQEVRTNLVEYQKEITQLKKKLSKDINTTANAELDIQVLDEKLNELHEIITEKVALENAQTKLEMQTELAKLSNDFNKLNKSSKKSVETEKIQSNLNEIAEMLNEKMTIEMNTIRLEFTEEMAKMYDRFYNEVLAIKQENTNLKKQTKTTSQTTGKTSIGTKKSKKESLY